MDDNRREESVAAHVAAIAARGDAAASRLTRALLGHGRPGGFADRSGGVAREWLRRWGPGGMTAVPACSCPQGRCAVCN